MREIHTAIWPVQNYTQAKKKSSFINHTILHAIVAKRVHAWLPALKAY